MTSVELGEKKEYVLGTGIFMGFFMKAFCFVVSVFIFFVLGFFLFNGNAPLIYCFDFLFLKFSLYSTFAKKVISKFDIHSISFINCIPKVLLVRSDILTIVCTPRFLLGELNLRPNFQKGGDLTGPQL